MESYFCPLGFSFLQSEEKNIKNNILLYILLIIIALFLSGCGKVGLKDPVYLPGLGHDGPVVTSSSIQPLFKNGDLVEHKLMKGKYGIIMHNRYRYFPGLEAWYCIVDFYPSSAIHLDFSDFDNYERRYVYEFELESRDQIPARWRSFALRVE